MMVSCLLHYSTIKKLIQLLEALLEKKCLFNLLLLVVRKGHASISSDDKHASVTAAAGRGRGIIWLLWKTQNVHLLMRGSGGGGAC
jgi:hypothetical protein